MGEEESMRFFLGPLWTVLLLWGIHGTYFSITEQPVWWAQILITLPLGIWGCWTYILLDNKKDGGQ
jgi:hypothetical protein